MPPGLMWHPFNESSVMSLFSIRPEAKQKNTRAYRTLAVTEIGLSVNLLKLLSYQTNLFKIGLHT